MNEREYEKHRYSGVSLLTDCRFHGLRISLRCRGPKTFLRTYIRVYVCFGINVVVTYTECSVEPLPFDHATHKDGRVCGSFTCAFERAYLQNHRFSDFYFIALAKISSENIFKAQNCIKSHSDSRCVEK